MIDTLWGTRPRRAITVAASILLAITAIGLFTDPDPDLPVGDMPTLPDQHETSTPDKPFWASTFTV
ncbi:MAG: hypothetical protein GY929_23350, partial [Actinomycetia bacterium]|nr:hypothetical protein [Actinomycetes bacterium]